MSAVRLIRLFVLDIDGVLTDGRVYLDAQGAETKSLFYRDLDALAEARRQGLQLALLTGEHGPIVDLLASKVNITEVVTGQKDKLAGITALAAKLNVPLSETAYIGDAVRDLPALKAVGLGLCPADAHRSLLDLGVKVMPRGGGSGAVEEAVALILAEYRHGA